MLIKKNNKALKLREWQETFLRELLEFKSKKRQNKFAVAVSCVGRCTAQRKA